MSILERPQALESKAVAPVPEARRCRWGRIAVIGLPLVVVNAAWIANSEMKTGVTEITISTLFIGVTFMLVVITAINLGVRRWLGERVALHQAELMALYSILSMSSVVSGVGNMGFFIPFLVSPHWYANNTNGYRGFLHLLPKYLIPADPAAISAAALGHSTVLQPAFLHVWMPVLLTWGVFFLVVLWVNFCMASILRRRWAEDEHLPFPVIALPLEITRDGSPIFKNRVFWLGASIPAFLHSLNSIASIVPRCPSLTINSVWDFAGSWTYPWSGMQPTWVAIHPAGVGFGFLVNTDVLFSVWFFYLLRKCLNMVGIFTGWRQVSSGLYDDGGFQFPYTGYVGWGAWIGFALILFWQNRAYVKDYLRRAVFGASEEDKREPLTPRSAVLGVVVGFAFLCWFILRLGGSWWLPVLLFGTYLLFMITLTRLQAETAVLSPDVGWIYPQIMIPAAIGANHFSELDSVHLGLLSWFNTDYRAAAMPHMIQSMVGQKRAGGSLRPLPAMLMIAAVVALVSAMFWDLQLYYVNGMDTGQVNSWRVYIGNHIWSSVDFWIHQRQAARPGCLAAMAAGALITGGLMVARNMFTEFPLSPAAFVLSTSWANDIFWVDIFLAWLVKAAILRYGGIQMYRKALPFFLGLILGDFFTGAAWSIVGSITGLDLYRTFAF